MAFVELFYRRCESIVVHLGRRGTLQVLRAISTGVMMLAGVICWAQPGTPGGVKPTSRGSVGTEISFLSPRWHELNAAQQQILHPLAAKWDALPAERKSKWMALAQRYPTLTATDQEKLQSRMSDWAALKPRERERARLNYAASKKLPPSERNADWEAYQALSPEERRRLAAKGGAKPRGAALAVKPAPANQLIPVPLTRRSGEHSPLATAAKPHLDRNTLLPLPSRKASDKTGTGN